MKYLHDITTPTSPHFVENKFLHSFAGVSFLRKKIEKLTCLVVSAVAFGSCSIFLVSGVIGRRISESTSTSLW